MRKLRLLLLLLIISFIGIINVKAVNVEDKVYDFANVLTTEEEEELKEKINEYIETYNMDMAVVTVKYHEYSTTEEYADALHDSFIEAGFGIGEHKDSIICILDFNERLHKNVGVQISTNGNAIIVYDDYRIERIIDEVADTYYKDRTNFVGMFKSFINKSSYYAALGIPDSNKNVKLDKNVKPYVERPFPWGRNAIISLVVSTVIVVILIARNKMVHKAKNADEYIIRDSINITKREDKFVTTNTTRVRVSSSSSSGGGGHAGGSSFHSSGGGFHGGGGRSL